MATMVSMDDLPEEVVVVILSNLSFQERKILRLINKRWLSACNAARFTKQECLKINLKDLHLVKLTRGCLNLKIIEKGENDTAYQDHDDFWIDHGDSLRSLEILFSKFEYPILDKIIGNCSYITNLALTIFDDKIEIPTFDNNYLNNDSRDAAIEAKDPKLESLTSLSLSGDHSFSLIAITGFLRAECVFKLNRLQLISMEVAEDFHGNAVMTLISNHSHTLIELVIDDCSFASDVFLENVLKLIGPQLVSLNLSKMSLKSLEFLREHSFKLTNLKCLKLCSIRLNEGKSLNGPILFKSLEFVSFYDTDIQNEDLVTLVGLQHLKGLDIRLTKCTVDGISNYFGREMHGNLIALEISGATDDVLTSILPNLTNVKFLDLEDCVISKVGFMAIITNCSQLTHLNLAGTRPRNERMYPINLNNLANLVHLNLNYCHWWVKKSDVLELRLKKLKSIGLEGIFFFFENQLRNVLRNCPRLERVVLFRKIFADWDLVKEKPGLLGCNFLHNVTIFDFYK